MADIGVAAFECDNNDAGPVVKPAFHPRAWRTQRPGHCRDSVCPIHCFVLVGLNITQQPGLFINKESEQQRADDHKQLRFRRPLLASDTVWAIPL